MKKYFEEYVMRNYMRPVKGYPDYAVTADGELFSGVKGDEYILMKPSLNSNGYSRPKIRNANGSKAVYLHRIVAEAFLDNPDGKRTVNHKDGNVLNNVLENLEWATYGENIKHSYDVLGRKAPWTGKFGADHRVSKPVVRVEDGKLYPSVKAAAIDVGVNRAAIHKVLSGKTKTSASFSWRYA